MKKILLLFAVAVMSFSFYSCRETTEERGDDRMEMGDDADSRETRLETEDNLEEHADRRLEEAETDDLN